ncbi:hypothetical protein WMO32_18705 [Xanthomonas oryzae pv. oryzicola]|uniref:hypothetical protein n=1 Tax=Xanthomonas oryzae TaxID=347 RepID=UPI0031332AA4
MLKQRQLQNPLMLCRPWTIDCGSAAGNPESVASYPEAAPMAAWMPPSSLHDGFTACPDTGCGAVHRSPRMTPAAADALAINAGERIVATDRTGCPIEKRLIHLTLVRCRQGQQFLLRQIDHMLQ